MASRTLANYIIKTLIFVTTKYFGLRGPKELSNFNPGNVKFEWLTDNDILITYVERLSKTDQPGLRNINSEHKTVQHFEDPTDPRSFYNNFYSYLSHVPTPNGGVFHNKSFWLMPNPNWQTSGVWFLENRIIGENQFNVLLKEAYKEADILDENCGKLTLRSIRPSVVVQLDENNIPSSAIKGRTGHKSEKGLDAYRRPQKRSYCKSVSDVLMQRPAYNSIFILCALLFILLALIANLYYITR